ncbi:hypothetical protein NG825_00845 [Xanthomonas sacchari]|nr:hypothetical protein NG825_00845 [Xanthomonas sacchari]
MDRQPPAGDDPGCGLSDAARLQQRSVSSAATAAATAILARLGDATFGLIAEPLRSAFESGGRLERTASSNVASACADLGMDLVERYPRPRHHHRRQRSAFNATIPAAQVASLASSEHLLHRSSFAARPTWRAGDGRMAATSITPLPTGAPRTWCDAADVRAQRVRAR